MAQQTAVEWYIEAISRLEKSLGWETENDILNQAKAMEKEQIINAFDNGCINQDLIGKEYYNETYNK